MWCTLTAEPLAEHVSGVRDTLRAATEFLDLIAERIAMPRRIADGVRRILAILPKLSAGRLGRVGRTDLAGPALDALELELLARGASTAVLAPMRAELASQAPVAVVHTRPAGRRPGRR